MSKRSSEKKHWDSYWEASKNLDDVYSNEGRIVANLEPYADFSGMKVLEVGAGSGRDSEQIAQRGGIVFTLDYSEEAFLAALNEKARVVRSETVSESVSRI